MAIQIPKIDLADAKTRVLVIFVAVLALIAVFYFGAKFFSKPTAGTGASHVAKAPQDLKSVPGSELTPEYYRALVQANTQAAQQAEVSGGSAVPTLLNEPGTQPGFQQPSSSCKVVCPTDDNINVENGIDDLVKSGVLSAEEGKVLSDLAKRNASVSEFAASLDDLVKKGKLTPEQARKLLEDYKKQHENALVQESGKMMDDLIKSGKLPLDAANELLDLQKKKVSREEYADKLNELVREGKISPETAAQLLAQYTQQQAREAAAENLGQLKEMVALGQISPEVAAELADYQKRGVSPKEYEEELDHLVKQGKLTPEQARMLLAQYTHQLSPEVADQLAALQQKHVTPEEYEAALQKLVAAGKITPEQAKELLAEYRKAISAPPSPGLENIVKQAEKANDGAANEDPLLKLRNANVSVADYKKQLDELVKEGKITPEEAARLLKNYEKLHAAREVAAKLTALRNKNASIAEYTAALKKAVAAGNLTPDEANRLLQEYSASKSQATQAVLPPLPNVPGAKEFAELQKKRAEAPTPLETITAPETVGPETVGPEAQGSKAGGIKKRTQSMQDQQKKIDDLLNQMSQQAGKLIGAWQPAPMQGQAGSDSEAEADAKKGKAGAATAGTSTASGTSTSPESAAKGPPLIKAGDILYAILETGINSDFPDSPVMATVVSGKYRGAKLLGKLAITQGQDRLTLTFKLMNMDTWDTGKPVNAFAIDPDTAKTALASDVNYHYFMRYGTLFASSFVQGYASAISSSGSTSSSGIFGTSTTHAALSPTQEIMTGIGQVGQTLGTSLQSYTNTPPTVKIDPGVSLGILFMADVS